MTLIIAADVQDHLILAGDHCAVLSWVSNRREPDFILRNYQKVHPWKYGATAASGDVFLMAHFRWMLLLHDRSGQPIDLLQVARAAKAARVGESRNPSAGNLFFTLPGNDGFELHHAFFTEKTVEFGVIEPISTHFSMREARAPDPSVCHAFNSKLRPSFFFEGIEAFHRYHLDLLGGLFAGQSAVDDLVTSSFDAFMLDKRSGMGMFWRTPDTVKTLACLGLDDIAHEDDRAHDDIHVTDGEAA